MKIDVCGIPFNVEIAVDHDRTDSMMGRIDTKEQSIVLSEKLSKDMQRSTLVHEWLHGILDLNGFGDESCNEQLVSVVANELSRCGFSPIEIKAEKVKKSK